MGRYENTLRYIQFKNFMQEKKYEDALELADQMEETKIKDVCELKLLADVYRKNGEYLKAKEIGRAHV